MERLNVLRAGCNSPPAVMGAIPSPRAAPMERGQEKWEPVFRFDHATTQDRGVSRFGCDPQADGTVRMKENGLMGQLRPDGLFRPAGFRPRSRNPEETWLRKDRN